MSGTKANGSATLDQLRAEKLRETRVRADLLGLQHQKEVGDLVAVEAVKELVAATFGPVRQALLSLPSSLAVRCNPSDPAMARAALEEWCDSFMRTVRERIVPAAMKRKAGGQRTPHSRVVRTRADAPAQRKPSP